MLKILGQPGGRLCDGVSRRDFIRVGGLAMGVISAIIGLVESLVFVGVLSSGFWS